MKQRTGTMGILDIIKYHFYEMLKKDSLTFERIRLEREEKRRIAEVHKLSRQMNLLYINSNKATQSEWLALEIQIKEIDRKIKTDDMHLEIISDQIRVLNNLVGWRNGIWQ